MCKSWDQPREKCTLGCLKNATSTLACATSYCDSMIWHQPNLGSERKKKRTGLRPKRVWAEQNRETKLAPHCSSVCRCGFTFCLCWMFVNTLTMTTKAAMFLMNMFLMLLYVMYVVFLSSPSVACTLSLDFLFLLFLSFSAYYRLIAEAASHSFIYRFVQLNLPLPFLSLFYLSFSTLFWRQTFLYPIQRQPKV